MTLEELRSSNINGVIAREAFEQATKRLADILDTKKSHEQKAFTLFSGYLTLCLGFFAASVALLKDKQELHIVVTFWVGGAIFIIGAFLLVLALLDSRYGALGSDPEAWIRRGVIDGDDAALPLMLAYLTYQYQDRIGQSAAANERKARWIRAGVFLGIAAPFIAMPCLLLKDGWLKTLL